MHSATRRVILEVPGPNATAGAAPAPGGLTVRAGELHLVLSRAADQSAATADTLLGLDGAGEAHFLGQAWSDLSPAEASRQRGHIGRVMGRGNWLENRSVMENLLLPLRHHTLLPEQVMQRMASELALAFGLPGVPTLLPHECHAPDLERAACVRAFLGRPLLVVLEHPLESSDSGSPPALVDAIQQVRRRGGAAIWFTRHRAVVAGHGIAADRRYRIAGNRLLRLDAAR